MHVQQTWCISKNRLTLSDFLPGNKHATIGVLNGTFTNNSLEIHKLVIDFSKPKAIVVDNTRVCARVFSDELKRKHISLTRTVCKASFGSHLRAHFLWAWSAVLSALNPHPALRGQRST